jgi:hypothetical protein
MNNETLSTTNGEGNGWDRPPAPKTASSGTPCEGAEGHRGRSRPQKPKGCDLSPLERARKVAELYDAYQNAGLQILAGELL